MFKIPALKRQEVWAYQTQVLLDLGDAFNELSKLPEALSVLEEAYSICCEWTGPADRGVQVIAVEIADTLRKMGDFERAEHFSRVTYEMMKEHNTSAVASLGFHSAASSRSQILTESVGCSREHFGGVLNARETDTLVEAEALARETLAAASGRNEDKRLEVALSRLLSILLRRGKFNCREVCALTSEDSFNLATHSLFILLYKVKSKKITSYKSLHINIDI
jgi:hypothetical protein